MAKTILVVLDGCNFAAAVSSCGYLEHMAESKRAAKYRLLGELPSSSRPMYETLLTGLPVWRHGITDNSVVRRSSCENLFTLCRRQGKTTAAAAYNWMSELYVRAPYDPWRDRFLNDEQADIQHGIFYSADDYPDSHLIADAEHLRLTYEPDFLLIHTMAVDHAGHGSTGLSKEYHNAAGGVDGQLAQRLPLWLEAGYEVLVTADHGMDCFGSHGGNREDTREVPMYLFSRLAHMGSFCEERVSQLCVAPLLCRMLELTPGAEMCSPEELGVVLK